MKAIVLNQPKNFAVKEIELPELKEDEVLIRIKDSGICTNDVRDFNGDCSYSYPRIGGHEYCGVIEELGSGVNEKRYSKGQKVSSISLMTVRNVFSASTEKKISVKNIQRVRFYES